MTKPRSHDGIKLPPVRGHLSIGLVQATGAGLALAVQALLARLMDLRSFGLYATALATVQLLVLPGKLGLDNSAIRFVGTAKSDRHRAAFIRYAIALSTVSGVAIAAGLAATAYAAGAAIPLVSSAALLVVLCWMRVAEGVVRGLGGIATSVFTTTVLRQVVLGVLALAMWQVTGRDPIDPAAALAAEALGVTCAVVWLTAYTVQRTPLRERFRPSRSVRAEWKRSSLALALHGSLAVVLGQSDTVLVSVISGADNAGPYAASWKLANLIGFVMFVTNRVSSTPIAQLYAAGRFQALQQLMRRDSLIGIGVALPAAVLLAGTGSLVLGIYGDGFSDAWVTLIVLAVSQLVLVLGGPAATFLSVTGHETQLLRALALGASVNGVLSIAFGVLVGPTGVAAGTALGSLASTAVMIRSVQRAGLRAGVSSLGR